MTLYTVPFDGVTEAHYTDIGGKATNLGLMRKKMPTGVKEKVPDGFGVSGDAFLRFTNSNKEIIDGWVKHVRAEYKKAQIGKGSYDAVQRDYQEFERQIVNAKVPRQIEDEIELEYENLCTKEGYSRDEIDKCKVAVRSSAICEDSATACMAGRYSSFVDIGGRKEVVKNVKKVWASAFEPRAIDHRDFNELNFDQDKMGIAIQRFIEAKCAGVMATSMSGDGSISEEGVFTIVSGTGEDAVQGTKDADTIIFNKVNNQEVLKTPSSKGEGCSLSDRNFRELIRIASSLEAFYGKPQDVEFVIDDRERLFVVQTRPFNPIVYCGVK